VPLVTSAAVLVHLAWPLPLVSPLRDRLNRQFVIAAVCRDIGAYLRPRNEPVYLASYQWTAMMRFQGLDARQGPGWTRDSHFTVGAGPPDPRRPLVLLCEGPLPPGLAAPYLPPKVEAQFPLVVRGQIITNYLVLRYEPRPDPATEGRDSSWH